MTARTPNPIVDHATLRSISRPSDARGLLQLAAHLAVLTATAAAVLAARETAWLPPAVVLHGVVLTFLFAPLHECIHRTAFRSRWLNDTVAEAAGFLLVLPPRWFRAFHMAHHRYTQDPDRDPELARPPVAGIAAYLWRLSGLPFWQDAIVGLVRRAAGHADDPFLNAQSRPDSIREARIYLAAYVGLAAISFGTSWDLLLWLWVLPALFGQPALRWFLMAEHTGCPKVADMRHNTRTTLTRAPLRFLCWNMCWHAEHHIAPAVPFFALPLLHRSIRAQLSVVQPGYFGFHTGLIRRLRRAARANRASEAM